MCGNKFLNNCSYALPYQYFYYYVGHFLINSINYIITAVANDVFYRFASLDMH